VRLCGWMLVGLGVAGLDVGPGRVELADVGVWLFVVG